MGGLITDVDIEVLRRSGYRVEVREEYVEQARQKRAGGRAKSPVATMSDKAWLKEFNRRKKVQ
jgi:hypothetical protein